MSTFWAERYAGSRQIECGRLRRLGLAADRKPGKARQPASSVIGSARKAAGLPHAAVSAWAEASRQLAKIRPSLTRIKEAG